jgi:hypothetical protein
MSANHAVDHIHNTCHYTINGPLLKDFLPIWHFCAFFAEKSLYSQNPCVILVSRKRAHLKNLPPELHLGEFFNRSLFQNIF